MIKYVLLRRFLTMHVIVKQILALQKCQMKKTISKATSTIVVQLFYHYFQGQAIQFFKAWLSTLAGFVNTLE